MRDLSLELPYIKPIFIGPNPQDRKLFMVDYDNKGYRGGTDTSITFVKLDKTKDDDIFEIFLEEVYKFDYSDYPIVFKKEQNITNKRFFYQLIESAIEHLKNIAQIGPPTFIFIKKEYLKDEKINSLVRNNIPDVIFYDKSDIIIGRKNIDKFIQPGLYLSYNSFDEFSIDILGNRAKEQYLIVKIKDK